MKIAYLIIAHTDVAQFNRLINALYVENVTDFYIHIDQKVDDTPFKSTVKNRRNIYFTTKRAFMQWAGYSMCKCQRYLLEEMLTKRIEYDRIICLSGLDYPIASNEEIIGFFSNQNNQKEYIAGQNQKELIAPEWIHQKIEVYHFFRDLRIQNRKVRRIFSGAARTIMTLLPFRKKRYIVVNGKQEDVYAGSCWWGITYPCACYIYDKMKNEKAYENYFKYSFAPDEMMIQTIVFNSPFAKHAILIDKKEEENNLEAMAPLSYFVYRGAIKIWSTEEDYRTLVNSGKLFCRKIVSNQSETVISLIDAHRNEKK